MPTGLCGTRYLATRGHLRPTCADGPLKLQSALTGMCYITRPSRLICSHPRGSAMAMSAGTLNSRAPLLGQEDLHSPNTWWTRPHIRWTVARRTLSHGRAAVKKTRPCLPTCHLVVLRTFMSRRRPRRRRLHHEPPGRAPGRGRGPIIPDPGRGSGGRRRSGGNGSTPVVLPSSTHRLYVTYGTGCCLFAGDLGIESAAAGDRTDPIGAGSTCPSSCVYYSTMDDTKCIPGRRARTV